MITPTTTSADVFTAAYDLFAREYLGGPRAVRPEELPARDALLDALRSLHPQWATTLTSVLENDAADTDSAELAFLARMATPAPGRYVPPYASVYLDGGSLWGPTTFKVLTWHQAVGLEWDRGRVGPGGSRIAAPDHVGVELAFLAILSERCVTGNSSSAITDRRQTLLAHLAAWLPRYQKALIEADRAFPPPSTLVDWTDLAQGVVQADLRRQPTKLRAVMNPRPTGEA